MQLLFIIIKFRTILLKAGNYVYKKKSKKYFEYAMSFLNCLLRKKTVRIKSCKNLQKTLQSTFTCSKLTICVVLVSLLLTLNICFSVSIFNLEHVIAGWDCRQHHTLVKWYVKSRRVKLTQNVASSSFKFPANHQITDNYRRLLLFLPP